MMHCYPIFYGENDYLKNFGGIMDIDIWIWQGRHTGCCPGSEDDSPRVTGTAQTRISGRV